MRLALVTLMRRIHWEVAHLKIQIKKYINKGFLILQLSFDYLYDDALIKRTPGNMCIPFKKYMLSTLVEHTIRSRRAERCRRVCIMNSKPFSLSYVCEYGIICDLKKRRSCEYNNIDVLL